MIKRKRYLIVAFIIIFLVIMEGIRLHYTIEAVKVSKEIKTVKNINKQLEKEISRKKIELTQKMNLDSIRSRAIEKLEMEPSKTIHYVKVKKGVSKTN